jgi:hypothetical protein
MPVTDLVVGPSIITQGYWCTDVVQEWPMPSCPAGYCHTGIDIGYQGGSAPYFRTPIRASRDGVVAAIGAQIHEANGYADLGDQAVCVKGDDGVFLEYGHCDQALVALGARVKAGQVIALMGTRGASSAPHLHLEARTDGPFQNTSNTIDPSPYLWRPVTFYSRSNAMFVVINAVDATDNRPFTVPDAYDGAEFVTWWALTAQEEADVACLIWDQSGAYKGQHRTTLKAPVPGLVGPNTWAFRVGDILAGTPYAGFGGSYTLGVVIHSGGPVHLARHFQ